MKTMRLWAGASIALGLAVAVTGQTLDLSNSSWGTGGTLQGSSNGGLLYSGATSTGIYFGTAQVDANTFAFGLASASTPTTPAHYNVASAIAADTSIKLTFTGLSSAPKYLAYTGGALTSYSYSSGTLTLTASTVNPVASASDTTGSALGSAFGLLMVTGGSFDFSGTVFRTNMFWEDLSPLQNYAGTTYVAGLNAAGQNGATASFYAYLPTSFLAANGLAQPDDAIARLQKNVGTPVTLDGLSLAIFASSNPGFTGQTTPWNYGGASSFNFNGGANDDYVLAAYANSSWSDGNIGIVAASSVPEPSTSAGIFGLLALLAAVWRRRALNNAPMR